MNILILEDEPRNAKRLIRLLNDIDRTFVIEVLSKVRLPASKRQSNSFNPAKPQTSSLRISV